jgi:uncharacterized membrane protein YphA (DoxX/SURF4 family)
MFPNGWPGRGLLLLRLVACSLTANEGIGTGFRAIAYTILMQQILALICAFLVLIGLGTPLAAIALSSLEVWMMFSNRVQWPVTIALGGIGIALAMLGPGSTSIDARLFGRKRIDLPKPDLIWPLE